MNLVPVTQVRLGADQVPSPQGAPHLKSIELEITTRCNLSCPSCVRSLFADVWTDNQMRLGDLSRILPRLNQVEIVVLRGWGEPLLHEDLSAIVRTLVDSGRQVILSTNGTRPVPEDLLPRLKAVVFRLKGGTAACYEDHHPGSMFNRVVINICRVMHWRRMNQIERPLVSLHFEKNRYNLGLVVSYVETAIRLGADRVALLAQRFALEDDDRGRNRTEAVPAAEVDRCVADLASQAGVRLFNEPLGGNSFCRLDPRRSLFVSWQGHLAPCRLAHMPTLDGHYVRHSGRAFESNTNLTFGNLVTEDLFRIWNRPRYRRFRETSRPPFPSTLRNHPCRYCHPYTRGSEQWSAGSC
ncbi:MAG: radical SAM protein [Proteobacteria bacterium]|nr:radical SAM protein [Pseudomonadota bacterium]MBU1740106.1 radical SAM protein [Pseudomonadota bacterium]